MIRKAYIVVFIAVAAFAVFQELMFRHYLFARHFFAAGCLPNFTAVLLLVFGYGLIKRPLTKSEALRSVAAIAAGLVLYEIAQIWMPGRVFDWADIAASLAGGLLAAALIQLIYRIGT